MDGRFTPRTAELIAGNVGSPFHLRGEATSLGKLRARGRDRAGIPLRCMWFSPLFHRTSRELAELVADFSALRDEDVLDHEDDGHLLLGIDPAVRRECAAVAE